MDGRLGGEPWMASFSLSYADKVKEIRPRFAIPKVMPPFTVLHLRRMAERRSLGICGRVGRLMVQV